MTNQYRIVPTDPEVRQRAADECCEAVGLPSTRTIRVYVLDWGDWIGCEPVGTEEREGWIPADPRDVDQEGNYTETYWDSYESSSDSREHCEDRCEYDEVPGRVRFWSEEDELLHVCGNESLGYVDIEVPYLIFGTSEDYHDMVASAARAAAIEEGLIEGDE